MGGLSECSKFCLVILLGLCLVSSEVLAKSLKDPRSEISAASQGSDEDSEEEEDDEKWSRQSNHTLIKLDSSWDPEVEWDVNQDHNGMSFNFGLWRNSSNFRIAVHLKRCNFESTEYLELTSEKNVTTRWRCSDKSEIPLSYFYSTNGIHTSNVKRAGDSYASIQEVLDNLLEVKITPKFKSQRESSKVKASLVISVYRDVAGDTCPGDLFNCNAPVCPSKCCADQSAPKSGSQQKSTSGVPLSFSNIFGGRSSSTARCIPKLLLCNEQPNCGFKENSDEKNEVCHPETYCPCASVCLTWNYVLTSLAIAVLFIITPTAIVFALFHRRNVALERARLTRLANARMADMRGEYTRDPPPNDHPPTYDEVYDIKEPPPCFCKATQQQDDVLPENSQVQRTSNPEDQDQDEVTSGEEGSVGAQNLGFQCSCNTISAAEQRSDLPPSYGDVRCGSNQSSRRNSNVSSEEPPDYR